MPSDTQTAPLSKKGLWAGRIMSTLVILFLAFDVAFKFVKPLALGNDEPMRRNSPTMKDLVVQDERDLGTERERLCGLINRFAAAGPKGCTTHPHSFFGRLTPEEWAELMYKHLDHHLRQFGV